MSQASDWSIGRLIEHGLSLELATYIISLETRLLALEERQQKDDDYQQEQAERL